MIGVHVVLLSIWGGSHQILQAYGHVLKNVLIYSYFHQLMYASIRAFSVCVFSSLFVCLHARAVSHTPKRLQKIRNKQPVRTLLYR